MNLNQHDPLLSSGGKKMEGILAEVESNLIREPKLRFSKAPPEIDDSWKLLTQDHQKKR